MFPGINDRELNPEFPMFQWRDELEQLCEFITRNGVESYLEIGVGTGQMLLFLRDKVGVRDVYGCDADYPERFHQEPVNFFHGNHHAKEYLHWREDIGHIDLVFIDANHRHGFRQDFEIERRFPHRYIALHDVSNKGYPDLVAFWEKEVDRKVALIENRLADDGFGVPRLRFPYGNWTTEDDFIRQHGKKCGIGITDL